MPDAYLTALGILSVFVLVAANGLFVATEFAYVAVRRTRIEQLAREGQARARLLLSSLQDLDNYIAGTQLGITISSLALGWIGEPALAHLIEPPVEAVLDDFLATAVVRAIAIGVAFVLITVLHIILGELAPKSVALQRSEATALWVAAPMAVFTRLFRPIIWAMNSLGRLVLRPFGIQAAREVSDDISADELGLVIEASARAGLLSTSELLLARRALEFSAIQADNLMIPRTEVVAIDAEPTLEEVLDTVRREHHTRYPVVEGNLDNVLGILDVKDLLQLVRDGGTNWRPLVRQAAAVPESVSAEVAVATMRAQQVQMIILVDEHGGTSGILTADELLYRLLGRWLGGGGRPGGELVRPLSSGNLLLSGLAPIADVEEATGSEIAEGDYDTIGGFLMHTLGRIPRVGDRVVAGGYEFRVMAMDGRRVDRVLAVRRGSVEQGPPARPSDGRATP
jgi:putative hemolysin